MSLLSSPTVTAPVLIWMLAIFTDLFFPIHCCQNNTPDHWLFPVSKNSTTVTHAIHQIIQGKNSGRILDNLLLFHILPPTESCFSSLSPAGSISLTPFNLVNFTPFPLTCSGLYDQGFLSGLYLLLAIPSVYCPWSSQLFQKAYLEGITDSFLSLTFLFSTNSSV